LTDIRAEAYRSNMTSPFPYVTSVLSLEVNPAVTAASLALNTSPPGAVQSGIDFNALVSLALDFAVEAGNVGNVFAQMFEAVISEVLAAANLAAGIVSDIEGAITIGITAGKAGAAAAAASSTATTETVSSVVAQVQQQAASNLTLVNSVFQDAQTQASGTYGNDTAGLEAQVLGGQVLVQRDVNAFLNSLPSTLSPDNDSNSLLLAAMQNLLLILQNQNNTLNQIKTYQDLVQPIDLTIANISLILEDANIVLDVAFAAITYAYFVYELLVGELVSVTTVGNYTVAIPTGATWVDVVLIAGGPGGGGYDTPGAGTGSAGGATTATPNGGATITATSGPGGASATGTTASAGGSPGNLSYDGEFYGGGYGGGAGYNGAGGNGTAPGGSGGGGASYASYGGAGGSANTWTTTTIQITSGMTEFTGTVGAGGTGGAAENTAVGGHGAAGAAYFRFYGQQPS
jgi:hypothetical protein